MIETTSITTMYGLFDRSVISREIKKPRKFEIEHDMRTLWFALEVPYFDTCVVCGSSHSCVEMELLQGGNVICDDCKKEYTTTCNECGSKCLHDDTHNMYSVVDALGMHLFVCPTCYATKYRRCDDCGQSHLTTNTTLCHDGAHRCTDCMEQYNAKFVRCSICNTVKPREQTKEGKCFECLLKEKSRKEKKSIGGYGKTHGAVFFSTQDHGHVYGTELEVAGGRECDELLRELSEFPEVVLKRDGSVPGGMEIVSYPMSLGYHRQYAKWNKLFRILEKYGYKSHDTTNCGYHIHMSRLTFGDTPRKQSQKIAYLLYLFQKFESQIKKFSRRDQYRYCMFYSLDYDALSVTRAYQKAVNYNRHSRYQVLNFQNEHTVECRIFRGTLNYETYIAAIELLEHLTTIAVNCTTESEIKAVTWHRVITTIPIGMTALRAYMNKRKLTAE